MKKLVNYLGVKATIALFFVIAFLALLFGGIFYTEVLQNHKIIDSIGNVSNSVFEWTNNNSDSKEEWIRAGIDTTSFEGDVLSTGTYKVIQTNEDEDIENQRIYSLYISTLDTDSSNKITDYESPTMVGGSNGYEKEIEIPENNSPFKYYLYIQKAKGGNVGSLKITKIED